MNAKKIVDRCRRFAVVIALSTQCTELIEEASTRAYLITRL
jgi:hypothetical protein